MSTAISLQGVSKQLSGRQVLRDMSFVVERGDIFGCLGPNGAGKTTTIRIILGLFQPSAGTVAVLGGDPGSEQVRKRMGFLLEADGLYDNLTAEENLGYYARLYDVQNIGERTEAVLDLAGLSDRAADKVSTYSKGMRQRLGLARSILHRPEVLVLDEPSSGLDPGGQMEVRQTLLHLARSEGTTIFLSSHNLDEMQRLANRIVLIHEGRIRLYGALAELAAGSGGRGVTIETSGSVPPGLLAELSASLGVQAEAQEESPGFAGPTLTLSGTGPGVPAVIAFLAARGVGIEQVIKRRESLEALYLSIEAEAEGSGTEPDGGRDA